MTGLPRTKDMSRSRDAFAVMVLGGIENLTHSLRRGDPYDEKALQDMLALERRLSAFSDALHSRLPLTEDE